MPRYFYTMLAQRHISAGSKTIVFEKTAIVGSNICGIYATDDPSELASLMDAVGQRLGVEEISAEDYEAQKAQKKTTLVSLPSSTLRTEPPQEQPKQFQLLAKDQKGVERAESLPSKSDEPKLSPAGKIEDLSKIARLDTVSSPDVFVTDSERVAPVDGMKKSGRSRTRAA